MFLGIKRILETQVTLFYKREASAARRRALWLIKLIRIAQPIFDFTSVIPPLIEDICSYFTLNTIKSF